MATEPTKTIKAKTKRKISSLKLPEGFLNETKNEEKNINRQIVRKYFNHQYPSFLVRDLYQDKKNKNGIIVRYLNESLIDLRNSINSKEIPENQNPKKLLDFNKQQKCKGNPLRLATRIKILTPKQMLQRLPVALVQVKAGNTSENLLNEIRKIIYSLYRAKEITEKVYNDIINSIKL